MMIGPKYSRVKIIGVGLTEPYINLILEYSKKLQPTSRLAQERVLRSGGERARRECRHTGGET